MWTAASIPLRDIDVINTELILADIETVEQALRASAAAMVKKGEKKYAARGRGRSSCCWRT